MRNVLKFDFSNFRGDLFGGITAGIVALPLALAFGAQTELGAIAGLYGAIAIGILAAIFGGTATQISGPTAPMTVVSAFVIVAAMRDSGTESLTEAVPLILATFFAAGLIEMLMGVFRLGRYIHFIPYPVVSGFMSGIGIIIIMTQIFPLLGYVPAEDAELVQEQLPHAEEVILEGILREEEAEGVLSGVMSRDELEETVRRAEQVTAEEIRQEAKRQAAIKASGTVGLMRHLAEPFTTPNGINWAGLLLGLGTIFLVYLFKRITTAVPSTLVALVAMTLVGYFFFFGQTDIIGDVPEGLPPLHLDLFGALANLSTMGIVLQYGFTLAALGAIDSLLTSIVADNITKTKHDSNQELIGQGIGNMGAALIGGLPGAGATMRTVINVHSGGKTKISGVIAGALLLAILLGLGPLVSVIPDAVLAGILITVGIGIIDYKGLRHLRSIPRADAVVMLLVLFLTVFVGLLEAVALGMVLAALLFMKNIADVIDHRTETAPLKAFAREIPWSDEGNIIDRVGDRVYIKHLNGALFFGFASRFQEMIKALPTIEVVIIRMDRVPYMDQSGMYAMEEAIQYLQSQDIQVVFTGLQGQPKDMLERINLVPGLVKEQYIFEDFHSCAVWLQHYLNDNEHLLDKVVEPEDTKLDPSQFREI